MSDSKFAPENVSVLFLEDEPLVAMDTSEHLRARGFTNLSVAYNLNAAEAAIQDTIFDVAILDINLGGGQTSHNLGAALRSQGTRVIFASGYSSEAPTLCDKGYAFLHKPYHLDMLEDTIARTFQNEALRA